MTRQDYETRKAAFAEFGPGGYILTKGVPVELAVRQAAQENFKPEPTFPWDGSPGVDYSLN